MSDLILVEALDPGVLSVKLNRPDRRNALNLDLLQRLCAEIDRLASEQVHRVMILSGAGSLFSSGLDLREAADGSLAQPLAAAVSRALKLLRSTPMVTIAAVHGGALAGGAGLMAACDMAIATADAKFGFPEVRRGLLPALITGVLRYKVREGDLRELFLTGEAIDAARALQLGLVQRVVPPHRLAEEARNLAKSVVAGGPETIRRTKELLNLVFGYREERDPDLVGLHLAARHSEEAHEGLAAFVEKREPTWLRK